MLRYYETIRHLRTRQIFFLLIKPLRKRWAAFRASNRTLPVPVRAEKLVLQPFPSYPLSISEHEFTFLNLKKKFDNRNVDWNFSGYGLLWNYHLNYFDFLHQKNISIEEGLNLIRHFIDHSKINSHSYDPYPVSLRGINWIKFLVMNNIDEPQVDESLYRQYVKLSHEVEYHLGANHLLENGFSLLFGAFYFHNEKFFQRSEQILLKEMRHQVLRDGAHIELSPMYHRIILHCVLDCINLLKNKRTENDTLQNLLSEKASAMLSWLNNMVFRNDELPDFNDSTREGAISPSQLNEYAKQLNVYPDNIHLNESGYRRFYFSKYEIIIDAGNIMPSYNPGHAHADMLSFCLNINDRAVIVDCGISTYENNSRRNFERSTSAHNTVCIDGQEQTNLWASFRVGRRARIIKRTAEENSFMATLSGFTGTGILHKRLWSFFSDRISITDNILENRLHSGKAYLHFHPDISVACADGKITGKNFSITFKNHSQLELQDYEFAEGFNLLRKSKVAVISFSNVLDTEISI